MKAKQMWDNFIQQHSEYKDSSYNAWSYGTLIDQLAELTVKILKQLLLLRMNYMQ